MTIEPQAVVDRIKAGIPDATTVEIEDLTGTKDHYRATVVAASFQDKTLLEQHQLVYKALGEWMAGPIHALSLATHTPESWAKKTTK